jgi:integrase
MIEEYQQKRLSEISYRRATYRPATVNREVEVMRRIYNLALREDMVLKNPCWKVTRLPERNARDRVLSPEEWKRLMIELPQHAADIISTAYHTGMRAGEGRRVYFNEEVRGMLERLGKVRSITHNLVFTYGGKPIKSIKVSLARALKRAKISDFRFHDLRHTFTTNVRRAGVDKTVIMKLTGHKTLSMFTRYNTVDEADAKQALNLMEGHFANLGQPATAIPLQEEERVSDLA